MHNGKSSAIPLLVPILLMVALLAWLSIDNSNWSQSYPPKFRFLAKLRPRTDSMLQPESAEPAPLAPPQRNDSKMALLSNIS
jgi:hypothetical protein